MSEEQPIQGNRWTTHAIDLLNGLGWNLRGDTNQDIPCAIHGRRNPHGIDAFLTCFDPYQNREIGVIIENKNYSWNNINKTFIQKSVDNLIQTIECVPYSEEFTRKFNLSHAMVNTGILMIWSHDRFEKERFEEYLYEINIPRKHNTLRISVLNNYDILKLYSIKHTIEELKNISDKFDIYYPSYAESDSLRGNNFVSLEYFHSKYIFGKMIKTKELPQGVTIPVNITIIFYFDKLTLDCLEYMYLALRKFQLIDDEIWIYHYDYSKELRGQIAEFERQYSQKKIIFKPMNKFQDVPWELTNE